MLVLLVAPCIVTPGLIYIIPINRPTVLCTVIARPHWVQPWGVSMMPTSIPSGISHAAVLIVTSAGTPQVFTFLHFDSGVLIPGHTPPTSELIFPSYAMYRYARTGPIETDQRERNPGVDLILYSPTGY